MTWRLFTLPVVGAGTGQTDPRRPKYMNETPSLAGVQWAMMDYGHHPGCLMAADVTNTQRNTLSGQADVALVPVSLDTTVGSALAQTQNVLEALQVPAGWVQTTTTWREVVRSVGGLLQFAQRYAGLTNGQDLLPAGVNLNAAMSTVSQARRDAIQATADSFGYDTSAITGSTTIRQALKILGDQWGNAPFTLGGMVF
jgi:hypothetical protein